MRSARRLSAPASFYGAGDGERLGAAPAVQMEGGGDLGGPAIGQQEGGALARNHRERLLQKAVGQLRGGARRLEGRGDPEQQLEVPAFQPLLGRKARELFDRGAGGERALVGQGPGLAADALPLADLEEEECPTHGQQVAFLQAVLADRPAVDEGALAASQVADEEASLHGLDPAVLPGGGEIRHLQGIARMAPDRERVRDSATPDFPRQRDIVYLNRSTSG
jgi:hypothetical protein